MIDYQSPAPQSKTNTLAIISLIAGIISVLTLIFGLCFFCLSIISFLFGVVAAIMGFIARKKIDGSMGAEGGRGLATAGMIMGIVVSVISIILFVIFLIFGALLTVPAFMQGW